MCNNRFINALIADNNIFAHVLEVILFPINFEKWINFSYFKYKYPFPIFFLFKYNAYACFSELSPTWPNIVRIKQLVVVT